MNKQIDRDNIRMELITLFHNKGEILKVELAETILDLIEEQTDKSYMEGIQDLITKLSNDHEIIVILGEESSISYLGQISEDFEDDIINEDIE